MKKAVVGSAIALVTLAASAALYGVVFQREADSRTWIVSSYAGSVQVRVAGGDWRPVELKTALTDGDLIRTGPDGEATLLMESSQVTVRAASELTVAQLNADASRFRIAVGQVYVEARGDHVSLRTDTGTHVDTSEAGLGMTVRPDGWTQVKVRRGDASFTAEGQTQHLKEGEESHAAVGKPPSTPVPIPESILLNVQFPDQDTFNVQLARVEGRADPGARVRIKGQEIAVSEDGRWSAEVPLDEGVNQIEVEASDSLGVSQVARSQPLRVDTTAPGLSGAAFGSRRVGASGGATIPDGRSSP